MAERDVANTYHHKAMELWDTAILQERAENEEHIQTQQQAFISEKDAAYVFLKIKTKDVEPTRGVLFRSAATMAFYIGLYQEAISLIQLGLEGQLYSETKQELNDLLKEAQTKISHS